VYLLCKVRMALRGRLPRSWSQDRTPVGPSTSHARLTWAHAAGTVSLAGKAQEDLPSGVDPDLPTLEEPS
jgi:hypothetical protein